MARSTKKTSNGSPSPATENGRRLHSHSSKKHNNSTSAKSTAGLGNTAPRAQAKSNISQCSENPGSMDSATMKPPTAHSNCQSSQESPKTQQSQEYMPPAQHVLKKRPIAKSEPSVSKTEPNKRRYPKRDLKSEPAYEISPSTDLELSIAQPKSKKRRFSQEFPSEEPTARKLPAPKADLESPVPKVGSKKSEKVPLPEATPEAHPTKVLTEAEPATEGLSTPPPKIFRDKDAPGVKYIEDTRLDEIWLQTVYRKWEKPDWLWELEGAGILTVGDIGAYDGKGGMKRLKKKIRMYFEEELMIEYEREWKKQVSYMTSDDLKSALKLSKASFHRAYQEAEFDDGEGGKEKKVLIRSQARDYIQPNIHLGEVAMRKLSQETRQVLAQIEIFMEYAEEGMKSSLGERLSGVERQLQGIDEKLDKIADVLGGLHPRDNPREGRWARRRA
ncbi:hypothetical protein TWF718_006798 [Orbilia javanica]|uniref:Uncharacterized protein n=1 Tax=Orbilia javanica TaxID=47235 RepID=A0AAN8RCP9_9PEZI